MNLKYTENNKNSRGETLPARYFIQLFTCPHRTALTKVPVKKFGMICEKYIIGKFERGYY